MCDASGASRPRFEVSGLVWLTSVKANLMTEGLALCVCECVRACVPAPLWSQTVCRPPALLAYNGWEHPIPLGRVGGEGEAGGSGEATAYHSALCLYIGYLDKEQALGRSSATWFIMHGYDMACIVAQKGNTTEGSFQSGRKWKETVLLAICLHGKSWK